MIVKMRLCVRVLAAIALASMIHVTAAADFVWKRGGVHIGRLHVPKGFKIELYDDQEGVVTTLRYEDGSCITLQSGGTFRLPLFQGEEYVLIASADLEGKTVRIGRLTNGEFCWREDNYKPKQVMTRKHFSTLALFPPNVGYSNVPAARRSEFDRALDSFVWEIRRSR